MVLNPGQATPGAPWRIRVTDELKVRFGEPAGDGFVTMQEAHASSASPVRPCCTV